MFIKEIVLDGFKCYEERTALTNLDRTFNAITGMNGAGKSNILDAVLFVLGLEGTKALRANNMKELVNIHRKECRAMLVICNLEKRKSPPGYEHHDEISISRAIDAEGRTKYQLNGHLCTLATLNKLCTAMGISSSRGSFSFVVMQGHITKVLSMRSRDLQSLLEEAAGTRPYEREKERAVAVLEKKEAKLREIKDALERRISPFYGRLREERMVFLEMRDAEERKAGLVQREREIRRLLLCGEIAADAQMLEECLRSYRGDAGELEGVERKIAELQETRGEMDVLWLKTSIDEESMRLEEIRSKDLDGVLRRKREEFGAVGDAVPRHDMDVLAEREKVLMESMRSGDNAVGRLEELASLRFSRSKLELQIGVGGEDDFCEERLREIESLRVERGEIEKLERRARMLRLKINYPFVENVLGTVEESIEVCDERYAEAVQTVLGGRAKYVITSDERVGAELLRGAEKSISVIPLSKIKVQAVCSNVLRAVKSAGGVGMIDLLRFDNGVRKAVEFVFSSFFVFENKEAARRVCFEQKVMCVTLDGTVYDPRGTLTGGRMGMRPEVVRRRDIEAIEREIARLEANERQFGVLEEEHGMLVKKRIWRERKGQLEGEMRRMDVRISVLEETQGDVREELRTVRERIVEGSREAREMKGIRARRDCLRDEIARIEEEMRMDERSERMCREKIESCQKMLGECDVQDDTKRMSEKEAEGLEPRQRYLIKSTSKLQGRISRMHVEIGKKMELLRELGGEVPEGETDVGDVALSLGVDPACLSFRCDVDEEGLRTELRETEDGLERCRLARTGMDPANFDLLEKNEVMIEELREKIERLERDRSAIEESIRRLDDLGVRENEKAFGHVNGRLGRLLQYFIADSDARICREDGEYVLQVRIGSWKESLEELSGGQRSLVALCLIFSMLTYRPAPFYIFDEIDSALDLSYTQSIGEIIRREFDNAQFLVVSLKNGMFDNANSVFKVFLQDGKSRICQIK